MSKKAFRQLAFQERRANFSLRIRANGRMDLLPEEAKETEIIQTSLREQIEILYSEVSRLQKAMNTTDKNSEEWWNYRDSHCRANGKLGAIKKMLSEAKERHYAIVFEFCAQQLLSQEALMMVRSAAWELLGKPPKLTNA